MKMLDNLVLEELSRSISQLTTVNNDINELISRSIEIPPSLDLGERSSNIAFKLAKSLQKSPKQISEIITLDINKNLSGNSMIQKVEPVNGYINFYFNFSIVFKELNLKIKNEKNNYGKNDSGQGKKIVIEHTSINPVKPLHIGNLRNAILGDIISRLYHWNGWKVEVQNLIDDLGRQVATLIWGFLNGIQFKLSRDSLEKFDVWLGRLYSQSNKILEESNRWNEVDAIMIKMRDDPILYSYMRNICQACVDVNLETAWQYGITYDYLVWESDISKSGIWEETLHLLEKNDSFTWETKGENKGCFVAYLGDLDEFQDKKNPVKIFVRSNGVPTYVAHDVALQFWKFGLVKASLSSNGLVQQINESGERKNLWSSSNLNITELLPIEFGKADRVCNVIGVEQEFLQEIVRYTLKLLDMDEKYGNSFHLSYKHVNAPHARFSGRSGNWYEERAWADAVLQDTFDEAFKVISSKRPDLESNYSKKREITLKLSVGAIRYWLAKFSTETEIKFRIEDATSLEGDTGPFLVYSHVRAKKILEKIGKKRVKRQYKINEEQISLQEKQLVLDLLKFPVIVEMAASVFQPIQMTKYANELASSFNKFYETSPVLNAETLDLKIFRIMMVECFVVVMENVLKILGISLVDEM